MTKAKPIRETATVTGNVSYISPERMYQTKAGKTGRFINVDVAVDGKAGTEYVQLTFSGQRGIGAYKGFRFDTEKGAWIQERPELETGQLVSAVGPMEIREWTAKDKSKVSKRSISILNFSQIKATTLPPAPWETKPKAKKAKKV